MAQAVKNSLPIPTVLTAMPKTTSEPSNDDLSTQIAAFQELIAVKISTIGDRVTTTEKNQSYLTNKQLRLKELLVKNVFLLSRTATLKMLTSSPVQPTKFSNK